MLITVANMEKDDQVLSLEVSPEMELENLKVLVQMESEYSVDIVILHKGTPLTDASKQLKDYGINDGDFLLFGPLQLPVPQPTSGRLPIQQTNPPIRSAGATTGIDWSSVSVPGSSGSRSINTQQRQQQAQRGPDPEDPESIRQLFLSDPHQLSLLKERNPRLAEALLSDDKSAFLKLLEEQRTERFEQDRQRIRLLTADPFDVEAQAKIAEEIRMENVNQNMQTAMEYSPENFAEVFMLYINIKINGIDVKAFVDSGAQMTIMSKACAERCNLMRLVDSRWQGMAVGVGQQKIIGRIHMAQVQIEKMFFDSNFTILENQPMDILLGLDMLKRHQCCIDLKENVLRIGTSTTGTSTVTKFLTESELPECARLNKPRHIQPSENSSELIPDEDIELQDAILKSQNET